MDVVSQTRKFILGLQHNNFLFDVFVGNEAVRVSDTNFDRVLKNRISTAFYFFGPGGGEKERLTILTSHF